MFNQLQEGLQELTAETWGAPCPDTGALGTVVEISRWKPILLSSGLSSGGRKLDTHVNADSIQICNTPTVHRVKYDSNEDRRSRGDDVQYQGGQESVSSTKDTLGNLGMQFFTVDNFIISRLLLFSYTKQSGFCWKEFTFPCSESKLALDCNIAIETCIFVVCN